MKLSANNRLILVALAIAGLAAAFWILMLAPKREEATELGAEVERLEASVAQHRAEAEEAEAARDEFPAAYQELVVLGKAVPGDDDTASLLVQLNGIAKSAGIRFGELSLAEGEAAPAEPSEPVPAGTPAASPTEVAASTLPLGASIGPAGLAVMPYSIKFQGDFFGLANFIKGLDSLVKTTNEDVAVDGRLITIDGFSLAGDSELGFPHLEADFGVTTYLTPPDEGITGGATPEGPLEATPTSATTEESP